MSEITASQKWQRFVKSKHGIVLTIDSMTASGGELKISYSIDGVKFNWVFDGVFSRENTVLKIMNSFADYVGNTHKIG